MPDRDQLIEGKTYLPSYLEDVATSLRGQWNGGFRVDWSLYLVYAGTGPSLHASLLSPFPIRFFYARNGEKERLTQKTCQEEAPVHRQQLGRAGHIVNKADPCWSLRILLFAHDTGRTPEVFGPYSAQQFRSSSSEREWSSRCVSLLGAYFSGG